jgi:hypothetical protein
VLLFAAAFEPPCLAVVTGCEPAASTAARKKTGDEDMLMRWKEGVLYLHLPKAEALRPKVIPVTAG